MKTKSYTELFAKEKFNANEQWIANNLLLETIVGSHAYAHETPESDIDIVGIVMGKIEHLYPQRLGLILGFDQLPTFNNKECKGINNRIVLENNKPVEAAWHSLANFFFLASNGSPNLIEVLFTKRTLVTYATDIGWMLRDNNRMFLSSKMYNSFKGYMYQQWVRLQKEKKRWDKEHKCDNSKRIDIYEKSGYDTKMASHCLRLLDLIHQVLTVGDLDLQRNKEECKAMKKGMWGSFDKFNLYVTDRLNDLESLYNKGTLAVPVKPQTGALHELLAKCIEMYYGSESNFQNNNDEYVSVKMLWNRLDKLEQSLNCKVHLLDEPRLEPQFIKSAG